MTRPSTLLLLALSWMPLHADDSLIQGPQGSADPGFFNYLLGIGRSELAVLEYERLKHEQAEISGDLSCKLGIALLKAGDYEKAEYAFENALGPDDVDSDASITAKLGMVRSYILQRKPLLAVNELNTFGTGIGSGRDNELLSFYRGAAFAASYAIDSSKRLLNSIDTTWRYNKKVKQLDSLLAWYKSSGMKDPFKAFVYSSAIPGWGHWQIGDRAKAVKSFLLMAGLTALMGYEAHRFYRGNRQQRYIYGMDIFIVGGLLWRRYYNSIRKAAYERAVQYNQQVQLEYQKRLREIIEQ
jgi:hypothetical protein